MKKFTALLLLLCLTLTACGSSAPPKRRVTVFAAASLTETVTQLKNSYEKDHPDVEIVCNFDSSGTLLAQVKAGASCDIFFSAGQKQMDLMQEGGYILAHTRKDLLENEVVLIVPLGADPLTFFDLTEDDVKFVAIGNSDVPVGQYAEEVFRSLDLWDRLQNKLSYGSNAKEVLAQVAAGAVTCGVVYSTDAAAEEEVTVTDVAPDGSYSSAVYPAALCTDNDDANDFYRYLQSSEAEKVFRSAGFMIP